jgi:hypothetical protein
MQVEAIYDQGRLEFVYPLQFKHQRVRLMVEVPDDEIATPPNPYNLPAEVLERAAQMRSHLDAIRNAALPSDEQLPPIPAKTLERIDAFALREDR